LRETEQARQLAAALSVDGSGDACGRERCGVETPLSAPAHAERNGRKARMAAARKLGVRLWTMLRDRMDYEEFCRRGKLRQKGKAHAGCRISTVVLRGSDRVNGIGHPPPRGERSLHNTS